MGHVSPASAQSNNLDNLAFEHILPSELQTIGYVSDITQDETGFMWFAGANGLARFDGYQIKIYRHNEQDTSSLSHNYVTALLKDASGQLWVATERGLNLYRPETDSFERFFHPSQDYTTASTDDIRTVIEDNRQTLWLGTRDGLYSFKRETSAYVKFQLHPFAGKVGGTGVVWSIRQDRAGYLWIATQNHGVSRLDLSGQRSDHYADKLVDPQGTIHNDVRQLFIDSNDTVWAGTYTGGVFRLNRDQNRFEYFDHDPSNSEHSRTVWDIAEDRDGNLWVGDGDALSVVDQSKGRIYRHVHKKGAPRSPGNHVINSLFEDNTQQMWIGYFPSGIDRVDRQAAVFRNYEHNPADSSSLTDGGVLSSVEQANGNIWVGAGYGLNNFHRDSGRFTRVLHRADDPDSLSGNTILSLLLDKNQTLWAGVWSGGLNRRLAGETGFKHYKPIANDESSLSGKEPWALISDHKDRLWIGTEAGVNLYLPETDNFMRYLPRQDQMDGDQSLYVRALLEDSRQRLWVGSSRGLFLLDPDSHNFKRYAHEPGNPESLSNNYVISLFEDSQQRLWMGTHGGGLNRFDPDTSTFTAYTTAQGLPDDVVTGIIEDDYGNLWLSTQLGLSQFNPDTGVVRNFNKSHGLVGNLFNRNTPLKTRDGQIFFGNSVGFVVFDPGKLTADNHPPKVIITDFRLFNRSISHREPESPLSKAIEYTDEIALPYYETMISFQFSALNYQSPQRTRYAYRLEGFDQDWVYLENARLATYTNLGPGNYTLHVKAANADGVWSTQPRALKLRILAPPWRTTWAYGFYAVSLSFALVFLVRTIAASHAYRRERQLNRRLQAMDKVKNEFLAHASHELRAPLIGIVGLAEALINDSPKELSMSVLQKLNTIATSGRRLTNLISDLLDYSRLADQQLTLNLQQVNLHLQTESVIKMLEPMAQGKPIRVVNALSANMPSIEADEKRLHQVLLNLVGNAIKYTHEGYVTVSGEILGNSVRISVEDSGIGIAESELETIFMPFHQSDAGDRDKVDGTGLGLSVCRKLVELHGGTIEVRSQLGRGAEFIFELPLQQQVKGSKKQPAQPASRELSEGVSLAVNEATTSFKPRSQADTGNLKLIPPENADKFTVLVVDDDSVNRTVLAGILSLHNYQVIEAGSGEEALEKLHTNTINLVLLDAIMPGLSGLETCRKIREDQSHRELPVLFISANARESDLAQAYRAGGTDYLVKPVSRSQLLPKVAVYLALSKK